jgi:hypothetical protein
MISLANRRPAPDAPYLRKHVPRIADPSGRLASRSCSTIAAQVRQLEIEPA